MKDDLINFLNFNHFIKGVPKCNGRRHASEIATLAVDLLSHVKCLEVPHLPGIKLKIRIGIHSGKIKLLDETYLKINTIGRSCNRGHWKHEVILDRDRNIALKQVNYGPLKELLQGLLTYRDRGTIYYKHQN